MATSAASPKPIKRSSAYVNNPFYIAAEGMQLFFLKALGVGIALVILSAAFAFNPGSYMPSSPAPIETEIEKAATDGNATPGSTPPAIEEVTPSQAEIAAIVGFIALLSLLIVIAGTVITGMIGYSSARLVHGKTVTLKDTWDTAWKNFGGILWLNIVTGAKILAWSLLFIVPGIVMAYRYSLASVSYFDKGLRGNAAVKHSAELTRGSWLTTFGGQTLMNIITLGVLTSFVTAGSMAVLYRQFSATPLDKRPNAHKLSVITLIVSILLTLAFLALYISLMIQSANLMNELQ